MVRAEREAMVMEAVGEGKEVRLVPGEREEEGEGTREEEGMGEVEMEGDPEGVPPPPPPSGEALLDTLGDTDGEGEMEGDTVEL